MSNEVEKEIKEAMGAGEAHRGSIPYGYQAKDGRLLPDLDEQKVILEMKQLREAGESFDEIAAKLNDKLIPSKKNTAWRGNVINEILAREKMKEAFNR